MVDKTLSLGRRTTVGYAVRDSVSTVVACLVVREHRAPQAGQGTSSHWAFVVEDAWPAGTSRSQPDHLVRMSLRIARLGQPPAKPRAACRATCPTGFSTRMETASETSNVR